MNNLNKSLDEISAQRKQNPRRGRNRFRRRGFSNRQNRGRNYSNFPRGNTQRGRSQNIQNRRRRNLRFPSQRDNRRRLFITNLNKAVTNIELKNHFQKFGRLRRCGINFTQLGQSKGTADVEFERHRDAVSAIRSLNKAEINGRVINVRFSTLRRINRVGRRIRFRNGRSRNLVVITRRNNRGEFRKRRIFKKSLGRRRRQ